MQQYGLAPLARVTAGAAVGVEPQVMGIGPEPATGKLLDRTGLGVADLGLIELNEAFASQSLAVLRGLGLSAHAEHVNPNGGGSRSATRWAPAAPARADRRARTGDRGAQRALTTMCIGVGQGIAVMLEAA